MVLNQATKDFFAQKFGDVSQCMCLAGLTFNYLDTQGITYTGVTGGTDSIFSGFALGMFQWVDMTSPARSRVTATDVSNACGSLSFGDYNAFRVLCTAPAYCYSAPPGQGACCIGYNCSITTQAGCTGTYLGDGTSCAGNPCGSPPPTGSCCIAGNCTQTTQANCTGTWTQGISCSPNPCAGTDCITGQTKCEPGYGQAPYTYYTCSNGYWVSQGNNNTNCGYVCTEGSQNCIGGFINNCVSNAWVPTTEECKGFNPWLLLGLVAAGTLCIVALVGTTPKKKK
jgi:hypothetical protein